MIVLGEPAYYTRFGFAPAAAAHFTCAYAGPYLMRLALTPGALTGASGSLEYASAFAAL